MLKLHYLPGACSLADHIVLEWIGQPYETSLVPRGEPRTPAFLAMSPSGQVPVLEEDGWSLTENVAILNYLADRFPASGLGGDGTPRGRAEVNRWLAFLNSDVHPAFKPLFAPQRFVGDESRYADLQQRARTRLRSLFERLDAQLDGRDWLAGARSIADPYLFVVLRWAAAKGVDLAGLDRLAAFSARLREDAGVKAAMQAEGL
jgi:glutathione S-transferase